MNINGIMRSAAAVGCAFLAATTPAHAQKDRIEDLIYHVRSEAAWHDVEVERIRLNGDALQVLGRDLTDAAVTLAMSCSQFGYVCQERSGSGFAAVRLADARRAETRTASRD